MTREMTAPVAPADVLRAARDFFTGPGRMADAWIDSESDSHISFCTFRGNLAVGATPDPDAPGRSRVRVSTLREEGLVPRLVAYLGSLAAERV
ncbi:MAG: hypothetical protein R3195_14755 [Gemmatimonadota bacterium]|nr:hypothetical protein [Gemmatimonadota bacterium]